MCIRDRSNLDAKLRTQMRVELIQMHERLKTTFVYVTHDQVEAMSMGDNIIPVSYTHLIRRRWSSRIQAGGPMWAPGR